MADSKVTCSDDAKGSKAQDRLRKTGKMVKVLLQVALGQLIGWALRTWLG